MDIWRDKQARVEGDEARERRGEKNGGDGDVERRKTGERDGDDN